MTVRGPAFVFAREQANISARITAPIRKLLARKGDNVAAGQVLAQLDNRDLLAQRDEAAAAVTDAEANLQRVTSGTLPTDIERARGQAASAEAALNQAQKFYDRRRQLFEQGAIPQRDLLLSETELAQAKANHEVAKRALDLLQNQSRDKDILMAKSKVEQAQARLSLVKAQLDFAEIRSTSAGTITEQFMFPGDMAKPDAPIFTVMDLASRSRAHRFRKRGGGCAAWRGLHVCAGRRRRDFVRRPHFGGQPGHRSRAANRRVLVRDPELEARVAGRRVRAGSDRDWSRAEEHCCPTGGGPVRGRHQERCRDGRR